MWNFCLPLGRPRNYCIYTNSVDETIKRHSNDYYCYADDKEHAKKTDNLHIMIGSAYIKAYTSV